MASSDPAIERRDYRPGEVIFTQGESGDEAFIVETGRVEIARSDGSAELVIAVVEAGDLIGEMALLDTAPRMATARAMAQTTCVVVPKRIFERLLKGSNPILVAVIRTLLRRLRNETDASVKATL